MKQPVPGVSPDRWHRPAGGPARPVVLPDRRNHPHSAWGEKMRYGIEKIGMIRKTFVIGLDGRIEYANSNMESDCYRDNILQARG